MKVGLIGTGKLGGPLAALFGMHHDVIAYDSDAAALNRLCEPILSAWQHEEGMISALTEGKVEPALDVAEVCREADLVFIVVQTPHAPHLDGSQVTGGRATDFDYTALAGAFRAVARATVGRPSPLLVCVVSTVLPGTCHRLLRPMLHPGIQFVYTPAFPAMGTVIPDYQTPEFVLIGTDGGVDLEPVLRAVLPVIEDPEVMVLTTSVESAELAKVAYNTFIGLKLAFVNMLMEVCEYSGADVAEVSRVLEHASHRLLSPSYLQAGMGDGGPCHPRDNLALSWLVGRLGVSYNLPGEMAEARERQTEWMARFVAHHHLRTGLPVFVLGKSYKAGSAIIQGSPALLLASMLENAGILAHHHDPLVDGPEARFTANGGTTSPALFVLATPHEEVLSWPFPPGSVVIDPWGHHWDLDGVDVIRPGRKR